MKENYGGEPSGWVNRLPFLGRLRAAREQRLQIQAAYTLAKENPDEAVRAMEKKFSDIKYPLDDKIYSAMTPLLTDERRSALERADVTITAGHVTTVETGKDRHPAFVIDYPSYSTGGFSSHYEVIFCPTKAFGEKWQMIDVTPEVTNFTTAPKSNTPQPEGKIRLLLANQRGQTREIILTKPTDTEWKISFPDGRTEIYDLHQHERPKPTDIPPYIIYNRISGSRINS